MTRIVKKSAIPLSGYVYQNLIGINVLCDWLDDPTLYRWVMFECDDEASGFQGLDDVVAERSDGSVFLLQAKFTVDPASEDNRLSWEWLLKKKPKGTSLIQKWCRAYSTAALKGRVDASLVTNRKPDREFESCLSTDGKHVLLDSIPGPVLAELEQQVARAELDAFFQVFEFRHSKEDYLALGRTVQARVIPKHTSRHGWLALREAAIRWASEIGEPPPDGHITLSLVRGVLSATRPRPLEQSFRVPQGYEPPDGDFYIEFRKRALSGDRPTILWGSPGQGKSTFLSYFSHDLDQGQIPSVRHHYFLSLGDTGDRVTPAVVADSIMAQIEARYPQCIDGLGTEPEHLRSWLEACSSFYAARGKPFVLIIDGLDHVWREHAKNKQPLDALFDQIFPLPSNLRLVAGSQRVDSSQLPQSFNYYVTDDDWVELPRMSLTAVTRWLRLQHEAERFDFVRSASGAEQLQAFGALLHSASGGHPLVLTYLLEQQIILGRHVDPSECKLELAATGGDVKLYYERLWLQLSFAARDALHLLADATFVWPLNGIEECLNVRFGNLRREIGHLLFVTEAGLVPFHGSLLVFVAGQADHEREVERVLPAVVEWLRLKAPQYHRWGWLWIYEARLGHSEALLTGPSHSWVVESLASGYPPLQVIAILTQAEYRAFTGGDLGLSIKLRSLKTRVINGPEFQVEDYRRVLRMAYTLSDDTYPSRLIASRAQSADEYELYLLALFAAERSELPLAIEYQEMLRQRINDKISAQAYDRRSLERVVVLLLELCGRTGNYTPEGMVSNIRLHRDRWQKLLQAMTAPLVSESELDKLFSLHGASGWSEAQYAHIELEIIRAAGRANAAIETLVEFRSLCRHPIVDCWVALYGGAWISSAVPPRDPKSGSVEYDELLSSTEDYLYDIFFDGVSRALRKLPPREMSEAVTKRGWLLAATEALLNASQMIAETLRRKEPVPFSRVFRLVDKLVAPNEHDGYRDQGSFRRAILCIASDLFIISMRRAGLESVPSGDWKRALECAYFNVDLWTVAAVSLRMPPLDKGAAVEIIEARLFELSNSLSPFNERAEKYLDLCELAASVGLMEHARRVLRRLISCVVGYGWRKNNAFSDLADSIKHLATESPDYALELIRRVAGIGTSLPVMTEDDAFRPTEFAPLLLQIEPALYKTFYGYWLERSEWYYAETTLGSLLRERPLVDEEDELLVGTTWTTAGIDALRGNRTADPACVSAALERIAGRYGFSVEGLPAERAYAQDRNYDNDEPIDTSPFGPTDLGQLLERVKSIGYTASRSSLVGWFDRCVADGHGRVVLSTLEKYLVKDSWLSPISVLLDKAFDVSRAIQGKNAAYKWIVAAQALRQGWGPWYSSDSPADRFEKVAKFYRERWRQFLLDSCTSPLNFSEGLVIPFERLVQYLVIVGEHQEARKVAWAMADAVIESFEDQPVQQPSWITGGQA